MSHTKGYILGILGAAAYGLNPLFTLPLYEEGMSPSSALLFRYMMALPILAGIMLYKGESFRVSRRLWPTLFVLGIMMGASSLTLFISYRYMDAGIASTVLFIYPILTAIIMGVCYHEHLSWAVALCIITACAGIVVLCYQGGVRFSLAGLALVGVSALTYSIYLVGLRQGRVGQLSSMTMTFYVLVVSTLLYVACVLLTGGWSAPATLRAWLNVLGLALLPTCVSLLFTTYAVRSIGSTRTSIIGALEPITAVLVGVWVFHEVFTLRSVVGILMVLASVTLVVYLDKR